MRPTACPCGSGAAYAACCGPCHDGSRPAATALALMRSRYSAYVLQRADYLLASWHPQTRPAAIEDLATPRWLRLEILATSGGGIDDVEGTVTFRAVYQVNGRAHRLDEHSRFERFEGRWVYCAGAPPAGA